MTDLGDLANRHRRLLSGATIVIGVVVLLGGAVTLAAPDDHARQASHRVLAGPTPTVRGTVTAEPDLPSMPSSTVPAPSTTLESHSTTTAGRPTTTRRHTSAPPAGSASSLLHDGEVVPASGSDDTTTVPDAPDCTLDQLAFAIEIHGNQYQPSDPPAYLSGDGMFLHPTVSNISKQRCTLVTSACRDGFFVQDAGGATVYDKSSAPNPEGLCPPNTWRHSLDPGAAFGNDFIWDYRDNPPFPPGSYSLRSTWFIGGVNYTGSPVPLDLRQTDDGTRVDTRNSYPETIG